MTFERRDQLTVQYATPDSGFSDRDKDAYEADLQLLAEVVAPFPVASLHIDVARPARSGDWQVKTTLLLADSLRLFSSATDRTHHPAFKTCVRRLIDDVRAFQDRRERRGVRDDALTDERAEVPGQRVRPSVQPDFDRMREAVAADDHAAFRDAVGVYRESLRNRIGRRIELFPQAAARIDDDFSIDDIVEEVFLQSFVGFANRPEPPTTFGDWLETLIDGAIHALLTDPEERANVSFVRSARGAES